MNNIEHYQNDDFTLFEKIKILGRGRLCDTILITLNHRKFASKSLNIS